MPPLAHVEIATLIAVIRLEADAYGVRIHDDIEGFLGRPVSTVAVYAALERLERRALLRTTIAAPLAVQGGRSKRLYEITATGRTYLRHEQVDALGLKRGRGLETQAAPVLVHANENAFSWP